MTGGGRTVIHDAIASHRQQLHRSLTLSSNREVDMVALPNTTKQAPRVDRDVSGRPALAREPSGGGKRRSDIAIRHFWSSGC